MGLPGAPGAGRGAQGGGGGAGYWGGAGAGRCFLLSFPLSISLVRNNFSGGPGGGHKGSLQRAAERGLRTGKPGKMYAAMIYIGRMRV